MREGKRQLAGWRLYDWANSAYVTTVAVAVLPAYFAGVVVGAAPEGGPAAVSVTGGLPATTLWGLAVGLAAALVFMLAPVLGAVADYGGHKRRFLAVGCLTGSAACLGLLFTGPGMVVSTLALFVVAQVGFVGGNVFYDAFLPQVARDAGLTQDRVSGQGYAWGYVGGGLQFAASLGLIAGHGALGLTEAQAARWAMGSAGLWWLAFGLLALRPLKEPATGNPPLRPAALVRLGLSRVAGAWSHLRREKNLFLFLLAFFFYNDGIQTVIAMATIYGKEELGFSTSTLMLTLLMIQFVAVFGALAFSRLAALITARRAIMCALAAWAGVAVYAYVLTEPYEYFVMGAVVGCVLGGSQALSRSLYAGLAPADSPAEHFAYFSVVNRVSSIMGPLVFAAVSAFTGSSRPAALCLVVFFVIGFALLSRVRVDS